MSTHFAYISGALTNLPDDKRQDFRDFYESLGSVFTEVGLSAYLPHVYGDPVLVAHFSPHEIDMIDRTAVTQSHLVVAYVGEPSIGTGIEIELAYHANIQVVLLYEKGKKVSRLVRGNPAVHYAFEFTDFANARQQLRDWLTRIYLPQLAKSPLPDVLKPKTGTVA